MLLMLRESTDWRRVLNSGEKLFELDRAHQRLDDAIEEHAEARAALAEARKDLSEQGGGA